MAVSCVQNILKLLHRQIAMHFVTYVSENYSIYFQLTKGPNSAYENVIYILFHKVAY
jgi:hypothetical protein